MPGIYSKPARRIVKNISKRAGRVVKKISKRAERIRVRLAKRDLLACSSGIAGGMVGGTIIAGPLGAAVGGGAGMAGGKMANNYMRKTIYWAFKNSSNRELLSNIATTIFGAVGGLGSGALIVGTGAYVIANGVNDVIRGVFNLAQRWTPKNYSQELPFQQNNTERPTRETLLQQDLLHQNNTRQAERPMHTYQT